MHASQPEVAATDWALERLSGVESSFQAACERTGGASDDRFTIAGLVVRLRFGSPALRDSLTRALAHLAQPSGVTSVEPALTVHLWDSATSGAPPPPTPAVPPSERPYRDAKLFADPEVTPTPAQLHAAGPLYYADDPPVRVAYYPALQALSILDRDASQAWHWVGDANDQPYWQEASPIRQILYWFLSGSGILHLHASSVGTPAGGVVAVGKGGSGKSTVALANLGGELLYGGDDYVAVSLEPTPAVHSLYSSGKLNPPHVRAFLPQLVPLLANTDRLLTEKAVVYANEHYPAQMTAGYPLRAVVIPTVRDQLETRVVEASRASALAALAPSTLLQLHPPDPTALRSMSTLLGSVPCFGLELGSDTSRIGPAILELLDTLPAGTP